MHGCSDPRSIIVIKTQLSAKPPLLVCVLLEHNPSNRKKIIKSKSQPPPQDRPLNNLAGHFSPLTLGED